MYYLHINSRNLVKMYQNSAGYSTFFVIASPLGDIHQSAYSTENSALIPDIKFELLFSLLTFTLLTAQKCSAFKYPPHGFIIHFFI